MQEDQQGAGISFQMSQDNRHLLAVYQVPVAKLDISNNWVRRKIADEGYSQLYLRDDAINDLVARYNKGAKDDSGSIPIADRTDAQCIVRMQKDKMAAVISTVPSYGGKPLNRELITDELRNAGIQFGVIEKAMQEALSRSHVENLLIARGLPPTNGEDARFELLLSDEEEERGPVINDDGVADYREMGVINAVSKDQELMRRIPPTMGKPGKNILGEEIKAKPGRDTQFAKSKNAYVDPQDPNLLRAELAGVPSISDRGVKIDPALNLDEVSLQTGNISFEGVVTVRGNVEAGMKVYTKGDIVVNGRVEAATLIAEGGNITVVGGVIGIGEVSEDDSHMPSTIARLRADGDITVRFIENCAVKAGGSVKIGDLIRHCIVEAGEEVTVGRQMARKGHILGGVTQARKAVSAVMIGGAGATNTKVIVGTDQDIDQQIRDIMDVYREKSAERDKLYKLMTALEQYPAEKREKLQERAEQELDNIEKAMEEAKAEAAALEAFKADLDNVKVTVSDKMTSGVLLTINGTETRLPEDKMHGYFHVKSDKLFFEPLK